jgi:hypothetical protein
MMQAPGAPGKGVVGLRNDSSGKYGPEAVAVAKEDMIRMLQGDPKLCGS